MIDLNAFNFTDKEGNNLKMVNPDGKLVLTLMSDKGKQVRHIGWIKKGKKSFYYEKREPEKDRLRILDAWGVHFHILNNLPDDGGMVFHTEKAPYIIDKKTAVDKGKYLHFKKAGLELRIFIPVKHWEKHEKR